MSLRYDLLMSWWYGLRVSVTRSQHETGLCTDQFHWNLDAANACNPFSRIQSIYPKKCRLTNACRFTANESWPVSYILSCQGMITCCQRENQIVFFVILDFFKRLAKISSFDQICKMAVSFRLTHNGWPQGRWLPRWFGARYRTWEAKVSVGNWRGTLT